MCVTHLSARKDVEPEEKIEFKTRLGESLELLDSGQRIVFIGPSKKYYNI